MAIMSKLNFFAIRQMLENIEEDVLEDEHHNDEGHYEWPPGSDSFVCAGCQLGTTAQLLRIALREYQDVVRTKQDDSIQ